MIAASSRIRHGIARDRRVIWPTLVLILVLAAAPAQAAVDDNWHGGQLAMAYDYGCLGNWQVVMAASAAFYEENPPQLPQVGDVFYVRTRAAAVGSPCIEGPQLVGIEIVLPDGVELAIGPATPVKCAAYDIGQMTATPITPAQGCPAQPSTPGASGYGLRFDNTAPSGPLWPVPEGEGIILMVPVRATRPLSGTVAPTCTGALPCGPSQAGDNIQFGVLLAVSGEWLSPHAGLFVEQFQNGSSVDHPKKARIRTFVRKGMRMSVLLKRGPARVFVKLTASRARRTLVLGRWERRGLKAGTYAFRLKPKGKAARALTRARRLTATLRLVITMPGHPKAVATGRIRLTR